MLNGQSVACIVVLCNSRNIILSLLWGSRDSSSAKHCTSNIFISIEKTDWTCRGPSTSTSPRASITCDHPVFFITSYIIISQQDFLPSPCLSELQFLPLVGCAVVGRKPISLTFPESPLSCPYCYSLGHAAAACPARPSPPAHRPCPTCSQKGHFGMKCPSLRKERRCHYCDGTDH